MQLIRSHVKLSFSLTLVVPLLLFMMAIGVWRAVPFILAGNFGVEFWIGVVIGNIMVPGCFLGVMIETRGKPVLNAWRLQRTSPRTQR
jgi:hypothetical protein